MSQSLLDLIRHNSIKNAYAYFSTTGQVSEFTFENELKMFRADPARNEELRNAKVLSEVVKGDQARVLMGTMQAVEDRSKAWVLLWSRSSGSWRIVSAAGGPFGDPEVSLDEQRTNWSFDR